ncbi:MAG: sulfatase-like hydrolase/transferase [Pseudomonadota bacterium]
MPVRRHLLIHLAVLFGGLGIVSSIFTVGPDFVFLYTGLLAASAGILLVAPVAWFRITRPGYALLVVCLQTMAVIHADNLNSYGPILRETLDAVFQTSNAEAVSYLRTFASPWLWVVLGVWVLGLLASLWRLVPPVTGTYPGVLLIVLGSGSLWLGRDLPMLLFNTASEYRQELADYAPSRAIQLARLGPLDSDFEGNVVLLLGESLSRHHLGIYGYPRNTTPYMRSIGGDLTLYRDVISSHSHTSESLSQALTLNPRGERRSLLELPDIITVAQAAGLTTVWLSNQNAIGIWDNAVAAIAAQADVVKYHDPGSGLQLRRQVFDDALLESLDSALALPGGKLIVLHTMATHFPYCDMVPAGYQAEGLNYAQPLFDQRFFGRWFYQMQDQVDEAALAIFLASYNCYDRAVHYLDSVYAGVVQRLAAQQAPSFLVFTADHGEAPIFDTGHESRQHSHFHVEVPFITWHNKSWPHGDLLAEVTRPGSLVDLGWTLADLLDIGPLADLPGRSLLSMHYEIPPRSTLDGRIGYDRFDPDGDTVERARGNLFTLAQQVRSRVWAHRINSGAAMLEARDVLAGVEMDLVWRDEDFAVYHPPAPDVGLTLNMQLAQDRPGLRYWLDWKNPDPQNLGRAIQSLAALDEKHQLKDRVLVETAPGPAARLLAEAGWVSSFYLPTSRISDCMTTCSPDQQALLARELWATFDREGFTAMSFDMALLPFIEAYLGPRLVAEGIAAYSWAPLLDISSPTGAADVSRLLQGRDWIKGMLVTLPSPFRL